MQMPTEMENRISHPPLRSCFPDLPNITGVDVGASDLDGAPPYHGWLNDPAFQLFGFEPSPDEFAILAARSGPRATYLPYALGNGAPSELKVTRAPGMTSLLEPDLQILRHLHGFPEWASVQRRTPVSTTRLDDVAEIGRIDYLKIDVQGSELEVFRHGARSLAETVCIQVEVNFIPFYERQPLFADIDAFLRGLGFAFHRFTPIVSRTLRPLLVDRDLYKGLSQQLWADAIYFRPFWALSKLTDEQLLRTALIAHDLYASIDLAHLALEEWDGRNGGNRAQAYRAFLGIG